MIYMQSLGTDSSWSMSGSGDENGLFLGGSIRMEVDGDPIDWDSNVTINSVEVISANRVHGTITEVSVPTVGGVPVQR